MAVPALNQLVGFPATLKLTGKRSEIFNSGASVTSPEAGDVIMRFELPAGWTFDNGTAKQEMKRAMTAGQTLTLLMNWRGTAASSGELAVRLTVFVSLDGHQGQEKSSAVMSVEAEETAEVAEASLPVLHRLDGFPPQVTLVAESSLRRSGSFTSGANVTCADAGTVEMRFEAFDGYTFDNGTARQSTTRAFAAGETAPITMNWRVSTSNPGDLIVRIRVAVSLQGRPGEEVATAVMPVVRDGRMQRFLRRLREMFRG